MKHWQQNRNFLFVCMGSFNIVFDYSFRLYLTMTIVTIVLYNVKLFVLSSFCVKKTEKV